MLGLLFFLWESQFSVESWSLDLKFESDVDVNEIREAVMAFTMHEWLMGEILQNCFVSRNWNLTPSWDLMLVNYFSVNEKMIVKVNVKMVSTMLNKMRSIWAGTVEPESYQINQFHNKDLSQHQLIWPGECFALFMNVSFIVFFSKNLCS